MKLTIFFLFNFLAFSCITGVDVSQVEEELMLTDAEFSNLSLEKGFSAVCFPAEHSSLYGKKQRQDGDLFRTRVMKDQENRPAAALSRYHSTIPLSDLTRDTG